MKYNFYVSLDSNTAKMLLKRYSGVPVKSVDIKLAMYYQLLDIGFVDSLIQYYYLHEFSNDKMAEVYFNKMCEHYKVN